MQRGCMAKSTFYSQAAKYIEYDTNFEEDEKKQAKAFKITCNLNNAACQLKLKDYKQAEKLCTKVRFDNNMLSYQHFSIMFKC